MSEGVKEYPRWVIPDPSWITHLNNAPYTYVADWKFDINRDSGEVKVLCVNAEQERRALAPKKDDED